MNALKSSWRNSPGTILSGCLLVCLVSGATSTAPAQDYFTKHSLLQSVTDDGRSSYAFVAPEKFRGIVLNNPEDMLDPAAAAPGFMGGQWQIFVQAVDLQPGQWDPDDPANKGSGADFGGTALWMGQYIGKVKGDHPLLSYDDPEWNAEMNRVNHPPDGHPGDPLLRAGDLIEVLARGSLWYNGKRNINEEHWKTPNYDFEITLVQSGQGLPDPIEITLSDVKDASDNFIFAATDPDGNGIPLDHEQIVGCERYQSQLVTIRGLTIVDPENWGPDARLTLSDGLGHTFPLHLGRNPQFAAMTPPTGPFDATGIFNQEGPDGISGYELWVVDPGAVPEPSSLALLLAALSTLLVVGFTGRRHRQ